MTLLKTTFVLLLFSFSNLVLAKPAMNTYELRAASYILKKASSREFTFQTQSLSAPNEICHPVNTIDCVQYVAGQYASSDERLQAARACIGNNGLSCVQYVAGNYASFADKINSAQACRGNFNSACAEFVAGSYASNNDRLEAARACSGADLDCVKYTAGSYPNFSQKVAAAKACSGQ